MKNQLVKRIAVLMAVAVMGMSVMACGDKAETETAAVETLTEEEYEAKTAELAQSLTDTMTEAQEKLTTMDPNDIDGAKEFIESLKAPFVEFAALQAPEKYAAAQEKYKSGCEAMVEYLDMCINMMDAESAEDIDMAAMTELLTKIQTDLTEGDTLMQEAAN